MMEKGRKKRNRRLRRGKDKQKYYNRVTEEAAQEKDQLHQVIAYVLFRKVLLP